MPTRRSQQKPKPRDPKKRKNGSTVKRNHKVVTGETIEGLPDVDPFSADVIGAVVSALKFPVNVGHDYFNEIENYLNEASFYSLIREIKGTKGVNHAILMRRKGIPRKDILKTLQISSASFKGKTGENSQYLKSVENRKFLSSYINSPLKFFEDNLKLLSEECDKSARRCYGPFLCPLILVKHLSQNGYKTIREIRTRLLRGIINIE